MRYFSNPWQLNLVSVAMVCLRVEAIIQINLLTLEAIIIAVFADQCANKQKLYYFNGVFGICFQDLLPHSPSLNFYAFLFSHKHKTCLCERKKYVEWIFSFLFLYNSLFSMDNEKFKRNFSYFFYFYAMAYSKIVVNYVKHIIHEYEYVQGRW